jgi:hypothetical protein
MSGMKSKRIGPDAAINYLGRVKVVSDEASATIDANDIVRVTSATNGSGLKNVSLATAVDDAADELAVAHHSFGAGEVGEVVDWAVVGGLDTSGLTIGDPWYLSESTGGSTSGSPGTAGRVVGRVLSVDASDGEVLLAPKAFRDDLRVAQVTIATGDVATLNATPVEIIAAPGAGKAILVEKAIAFLDFATAAYDGAGAGEDLVLQYTSGTAVTDAVDHDGFGNATADAKALMRGLSVLLEANDAVEATILSGEWYAAAGDSPVIITVWYRVVDA